MLPYQNKELEATRNLEAIYKKKRTQDEVDRFTISKTNASPSIETINYNLVHQMEHC